MWPIITMPSNAHNAPGQYLSPGPKASLNLEGKRVAMLSFSPYPVDPRPRRAAETLLKEGMNVDFICWGDGKSPKREVCNGVSVLRLPIEHRRGGKLSYAY